MNEAERWIIQSYLDVLFTYISIDPLINSFFTLQVSEQMYLK